MSGSLPLMALCGALALAAGPVAAVDGISVEYGKSDSSNSDVNLYRIGLQWKWQKRWFDTGNWHVGGFWDLSLGRWDNRTIGRTNSGLADIGLTPTFRLQQNSPSGVSPYLEAAIGVHLFSETEVGPQRRFGSGFSFGDHIGAGLRFGSKGAFDLGYRYQHLSNGGLKAPNQGINFHQIRLQYHF
jgi:hypothetical protein